MKAEDTAATRSDSSLHHRNARLQLITVWLALLLSAAFAARAQPVVNSFTLIDADADAPIAGFNSIPDGAIIDLTTLPTANLNVRANTTPSTDFGSVEFSLTGATTRNQTEGVPPWALVLLC